MMKNDPNTLMNLIAQTVYDKKGINILGLDVRGISTITDFVIIAEGNVDKHVQAIAKAVIEALQSVGENALHVEGMQEGDWVVVDYLNIMVHLFMPGLRDKYRLEQLWSEGKILDLAIVTASVPSGTEARMRRS